MRFRVFVQDAAGFNNWTAATKADAASPSSELAKAGEQQFTLSGCIGCHTVQGNKLAVGKAGPNLTHVGSRTTIAAGVLSNNEDNLH